MKSDIEKIFNKIGMLPESSYEFHQMIRDHRVARSGYCYVLDVNGKVAAHPQQALVGFSFADNPAVQYILVHKNGCIRLSMTEEKDRIVLFRPLKSGKILCLTLMAEEVSDGGMFRECRDF